MPHILSSMSPAVLLYLCLVALTSGTASATQQQQQASLLDRTLQHLALEHDAHVEDLRQFVRFPSVSALPQHAEDLRKTAQWVADRLSRAGMQVQHRGVQACCYG